jgi:hypothetical protein
MFTRPAPHVPHERVKTEHDPVLDAWNAAFDDLELDWRWDHAILRELAGIQPETDRIIAYLRAHRPHLLQVYDADALAAHIVEVKDRLLGRTPDRRN